MPYAAGGLVKISQSGRCIEAIAASCESVPPTVLVELDPETFRRPRRLAFGHDLQRALLRWAQIALKPAAIGMHGIFMRCECRKCVIADSAAKHVQVHAWAFWLDADEHHLGLAPRTGWARKWSRRNGPRQSGGPPLFELSFEVRRDRAHDPNSGVRDPAPVLTPQRSPRPKGPKQHQRNHRVRSGAVVGRQRVQSVARENEIVIVRPIRAKALHFAQLRDPALCTSPYPYIGQVLDTAAEEGGK